MALAEERRPRLGTPRALGLTRRGLVVLSVLEGALHSVAAAAGSQLAGVMDGVIGTRQALAPLSAAIRRALFDQAVDAVTMHALLENGYRQNLAWTAIHDLRMRMGLVVGVVSSGEAPIGGAPAPAPDGGTATRRREGT